MNSAPEPVSTEQLLVHAQWVRRLALGLVKDPTLADDVVQDTWITALERPPVGEGESKSLKAWLGKVVRSSVLQRFRGESRRRDRERLEASERGQGNFEPESDLMEQLDSQRRLVQEVMSLSEPMRSTVVLRYFKNLSSAEIAQQQDLPAATVRSRLNRALSQLRSKMDEQYEGDRSAWCLALVGLWGTPPPPVPVVPSSELTLTGSSVANGVLIMKVGLVLLSVVGVAAITLAGIYVFGEEPGSTVTATESVEPEVAALPELAVRAPDIAPVEDVQPRQRQAVTSVAPKPTQHEIAPPIEAPETIEACTFVARFIDEIGNPVAGVELVSRDKATTGYPVGGSAISGPNGTVRLTHEMTRKSEAPLLSYKAMGFAAGVSTTAAESGEEVHIGDITLLQSVRITGRVIDSDGAPIANAKVYALGPEFPNGNEWQAKRAGPNSFGGIKAAQSILAVQAGHDGEFEVNGAFNQELRLWAGAEGWRYGWTEVFELELGRPVMDVEIMLEPLAAEDQIAGIALSAEGIPLPHYTISYEFGAEDISMSTSLQTDETGAFKLTMLRPTPYTFTMQGNDEFPGQAIARSVEPGTLALVMRLSLTGEIELFVENADGQPITTFNLQTQRIHSNGSMGVSQDYDEADGRVELPIPSDQFAFTVNSNGYAAQSLGPYDADTCPRVIRCVLEPAVGVSGVVSVGSQPAGGVRVQLFRMARRGVRNLANGFHSRVQGSAVASTTTDEAGAFLIMATVDGEYFVRAEAPEGSGCAAVESSIFELDVRRGHSGLQLEPQRSASLLVLVRTLPGRDSAGVIVGITDGAGDSRTKRSSADGTVEFSNLRPGSWHVAEAEQELAVGLSSFSSSSGGSDYEIPWNLELSTGESAEFELVLGEEE